MDWIGSAWPWMLVVSALLFVISSLDETRQEKIKKSSRQRRQQQLMLRVLRDQADKWMTLDEIMDHPLIHFGGSLHISVFGQLNDALDTLTETGEIIRKTDPDTNERSWSINPDSRKVSHE